MASRWVRRTAVLLLILAAAVTVRLTVFRPAALPVTVYRVAAGRVEETVTNSRSGTVKSRRRATLSPEVGGRIVELPIRKGTAVRAGDLLLRVQDADLRAQLDVQKRSLEAAEASEREACESYRWAARDLERNDALAADGVVSAALLDQSRSRRDTSLSACEAARSQRGQAQAAV